MAQLGIELELIVLLALAVLGPAFFAVFEVETPGWRKALKWALVVGLTLGLYAAVGHWSLVLPAFTAAAGCTFHVMWCRRNGIDPVHATPRRRYYELRGWRWVE
ncbi:MAG: hypothetical protein HOP28_09240 [Gemmatimonadales bacterium]|nr:hypothetical protein [Gemmatimonadales bacterium]